MAKAKIKKDYPEIDDIRHDLESLKTNVVELTRHVQENGADKTNELTEKARKRLEKMRVQGRRELQKVERQVKEKPAQSLAIAFAAGAVASLLLGRRR